MADATYRRFDVKHGISVNGSPFVDDKRNIIVNDLTVQGVSTVVDTRTITTIDPVITLGNTGKQYTAEAIISGTPGRIKFPNSVAGNDKLTPFDDIAVGDALKYELGVGGTLPQGLTDGAVYYVLSKDETVTSATYRTITIASSQGGQAIAINTSGSGDQKFTLNPLRDLDQDLGIQFHYVDGTAKKGFFGYKNLTDNFTFLLDATYNGSDTQADQPSPRPDFAGTKGGIEVRSIKLEPTAALTSSSPAVDIDQTWNSAGVSFKAFEIDVVDTASAASSSLLDIAVGGNQKLLLRKDGALAINSSSYGAALNIDQGSIAENTLVKGSATWNNSGITFTGIDLQVTETAFAAGSKLVNFYASASRYLSVDAYGKTENEVEFTGGSLQTALRVDVTDTSSAADSLLLDLQVGGVSKFSVDKDGDVIAAGDVTFNGSANFEDHLDIQTQPNGSGTYEDNTRFQTSFVTIAAGTSTASVINTFDKTQYVTGKYLIQMKQGVNYHSAEVLLIHDGSGAFMTEYASVWNASILGTLDATISGNNVNLTFTATAATVAANAQVQVRITRISMTD